MSLALSWGGFVCWRALHWSAGPATWPVHCCVRFSGRWERPNQLVVLNFAFCLSCSKKMWTASILLLATQLPMLGMFHKWVLLLWVPLLCCLLLKPTLLTACLGVGQRVLNL